MPRYDYTARNPDGSSVQGVYETVSEALALDHLRSLGLLVVRIGPSMGSAARRPRGLAAFRSPRRIDVEVELRQLAFLLRSGLPLLESLRTCASQSERRSVAWVWTQVGEAVRAGSSLVVAIRRHRCFPPLVASLIDVGEQTGRLQVVLERAAAALQHRRERRSTVVTAMIYPALVLLLAIGTVIYLVGGLLPRLSGFLLSIGRPLPGPTQFLVDLSLFMQANATAITLVGALAAGVVAVLFLSRLRGVWVDPLILRVPLLGSIVRFAGTADFSHGLALLLESGVRLTSALQTVAPLVRNRRLASAVECARERVLQGFGFSESLAREGSPFGSLLTSTIAVGETSGTLEEVLAHAAEFHDERLRSLVRRLGTIIEPTIVIVIGSIVGFVYIAFFMAIYAVAGTST